MTLFRYSIISISLLFSACGEAETPGSSAAAAILRSTCPQSASLTPSYHVRQGQQLQGLTGPGFTVQGARFGCQSVSGLAVEGAMLVGTAGNQARRGTDFAGAALSIVDSAGVRAEVAITQAELDPLDNSGGTTLYTLMTLNPLTLEPMNLCAPDADGRAAALPLRGSWDASGAAHADGSLSFYCTSGVVAKCVRWGYHPGVGQNGTDP